MNVFTKALARVRRMSGKQLAIATVFTLAVVGAAALGNSVKQTTYAADCSPNAIMKCGTTDTNDFINRVSNSNNGTQTDLQAIYNGFGLEGGDYARFRNEAKPGTAYKDGTIVVDGRIVATDAWSIGRSQKPYSWNWNGYWASRAQDVFRGNAISVMVLFDDNGDMEFAVMHDCGNPSTGRIVRNSFKCEALTKTPVQGEKDTYLFTTTAPHSSGVSINKVVYDFGDGTSETRTDLTPVKHKFTKVGKSTVTVNVTFNLPGGKTKTVTGVSCQTVIEVLAPFYKCVMLTPAVLNDKKTQFRFTVKTSQGNGATLKDVDFVLDNKTTTTGVTTKDAQGNIYKEYTVAEDGAKHTVLAKVNFNLESGVVSDTCKAEVTSTKAPECVEKPGSGLPPGHPDCQPPKKEECKPNIPKDDARCVDTPPVLPNAGMGNVLGLFAGTSAAGAVVHRVLTSRRRS